MQRFIKRYLFWFFYLAFLLIAMNYGSRESLFSNIGTGKIMILMIFAGFVIYSLVATEKENFFKTVRIVNGYYWGRQIGIDLYISVFLSLMLIYLVEGSFVVLALWFVPVLIFANLAILPYILLNYSAIASLLSQ